MSRRTGFFGGSPGPPIGENASSRHVPLQQYGQFPSGSQVYAGGGGGFDALSQGMNGADPVYYAQDGNLMHSNFGYDHNAYPYGSTINAFYQTGPSCYYTQTGQPVASQLVDSSKQYTEWSSPDFVTPFNISPPDVLPDGINSPTPENRSSSNDSAGKSRRFSRQRNVKDGDGARPRSNPSNKPQFKSIPKHEIRFSHQKRDFDKNANKEKAKESTVKIKQKEEDARFSIIRSIGKREIDTGFGETKPQLQDQPEQTSLTVELKTKLVKKKSDKPRNYQSSESQLSLLLEQLTNGTYECMVCCDRVKQHHAIWNCEKCYHVFHMGCIKKWARSPAAYVEDEGWRCPGCQSINKKFPSAYKCYCGKVNEPEWNRRETPHSCGEVCGKKRSNNATCTHPCNILCHPGPCPPCPASVIKPCLCGKMTRKVRCSQQTPLMCSKKCGRMKNCGLHKCGVICHSGECNSCDVLVEQKCFCNKDKRYVLCGSEEFQFSQAEETNIVYSCGKTCEKNLSCINHECGEVCHKGQCKACPLLPSLVTTCPCTQMKISDLTDEDGKKYIRAQCTDPVPTCDKICGKPLRCGEDEIHTCQQKCHIGPCPPCADNTSTIHCRCGKSENDVACAEIPNEPYICDRRCNKKRKCGRHKCGKTCCTDTGHQCTQICGRKLECKLHRCEEMCHRGNCHTCYNVSFDELSCHCGAQIMFPPIPCGTKPPECTRQCMRQHPCFHNVNHNCHNEEKCPPCVVLLKKQCNCGRVMRNNIPCYQANVSCGAPCKKVIQCGHNCPKPCHQGPCMEEDAKCTQPCSIMRIECIHPCATSCHQGKACPNSPCKAMVTLKCSCGNREMQVECSQGGAMYQRLSSEAFARQQTAKGSVDISNLLQGAGKQKILPCDDQCTTIERNKRLAEALEIDEQNSVEAEQQMYSSFLLMWVKQDPAFVLSVEQELSNVIDAVSWLDKTKRSHTFPSMKREKRQVVHELAESFHCKSLSMDEEPKRSVLVTAIRGVSRIPHTLLSDRIKKKPADSAFVKQSAPQLPGSSDGTKRLLKSMKLVSLTSGPTSSDRKSPSASQVSKRPASIPRMPSYPSSLGKAASTSSRTYIEPLRDFGRTHPGESRTTYQSLPTYSQKSAPVKVSGPVSSRQPLRSKKDDEPEIDYFDMTC